MPFAPFVAFLLLVVRPGAPTSFLLLVAMPFAPSIHPARFTFYPRSVGLTGLFSLIAIGLLFEFAVCRHPNRTTFTHSKTAPNDSRPTTGPTHPRHALPIAPCGSSTRPLGKTARATVRAPKARRSAARCIARGFSTGELVCRSPYPVPHRSLEVRS